MPRLPPTLTLVLAEAELELVPDQIKGHPSVRAAAGRKESRAARTLLDSSIHHDAMKHLPDGERRGRPDLTHYFLLLALDSVLNKQRGLRLVVHTRSDERISVAPETRIMRNYPRFIGLMEQLFRFRQVPQDPVLFRIDEGWTLERVLREEARGPIAAFSEHGRKIAFRPWVAEKAAAGDLTVVLGGFPKGDFRSPIDKLAAEIVSIRPEPLSVWTVETALIAFWEDAVGLYGP